MEVQCFEPSNATEICNGIMFDFYLRLPHECLTEIAIEAPIPNMVAVLGYSVYFRILENNYIM